MDSKTAAATHVTPTHAELVQAKMSMLTNLGENVIYLMGTSFVLGSLFTIFILLLLDFMQRDRVNPK